MSQNQSLSINQAAIIGLLIIKRLEDAGYATHAGLTQALKDFEASPEAKDIAPLAFERAQMHIDAKYRASVDLTRR